MDIGTQTCIGRHFQKWKNIGIYINLIFLIVQEKRFEFQNYIHDREKWGDLGPLMSPGSLPQAVA